METINRDVIVVIPLQPLYDWVNTVFPDDPIHLVPGLMNHDEAKVYLIPEQDSSEHFEKWIKKHYKEIFEEELFDWCIDENYWPEKLTFNLFNTFFQISYQSVIIDTISHKWLGHE